MRHEGGPLRLGPHRPSRYCTVEFQDVASAEEAFGLRGEGACDGFALNIRALFENPRPKRWTRGTLPSAAPATPQPPVRTAQPSQPRTPDYPQPEFDDEVFVWNVDPTYTPEQIREWFTERCGRVTAVEMLLEMRCPPFPYCPALPLGTRHPPPCIPLPPIPLGVLSCPPGTTPWCPGDHP